ncbi:ATP-sensitive inward rectifier potassium channel 8-like isoform X2 [Bacillus rossius redtenbacheri]|uniref:ATP-sensitive inward rectifier potassium channel 8-like isoform X2 n=1 Tax=Bacillus rossius redtenbacheri TaxID=93214 RepID=UPI002FDD433B
MNTNYSKTRYVEVQMCSTQPRRILKSGECNVHPKNWGVIDARYLRDFITTLVDMKWRWVLLILNASFFSSWFLFAVLWWISLYAHGDLEPGHLPPFQAETGWTPCVTGIYNFTSIFMLSMENQHTTGFGARMPTEECPEAVFLMCMQAIVGVTIQAVFVGIVFAKLIRPKQRTNTLLFGHHAVVCMRYGKLCLVVRIGDLRKSNIIECNVSMQLVVSNLTPEGEVLSPVRTELSVLHKQTKTQFYLLWPEQVVHVIDKNSPLYEMSAHDLARANLEIMVVLEGTMDSTDQRVQAKTSYIPEEIRWGHRFCPLVIYDKERRSYVADYSQFDLTFPINTPLCSAEELDLQQAQGNAETSIQNIGIPDASNA